MGYNKAKEAINVHSEGRQTILFPIDYFMDSNYFQLFHNAQLCMRILFYMYVSYTCDFHTSGPSGRLNVNRAMKNPPIIPPIISFSWCQ